MLNATILSAYRYGKRELQRAPTSPLFRITRRVHAVFLDESAGEYSVCLKMKGGQGPSMLMPQLLLKVWARIRNTIVLITHDIDEALFLVDRILVMSPRPGRIIDEITRDFARPRGAAARPRRLAGGRLADRRGQTGWPLRRAACV